MRQRPWLPPTMLAGFVFLWLRAAWDPLDRFDWLLENLLVFLFVPALVVTYRRHRFSDASYVLLFLFVGMHVLGSHWSYSRVPWPDWRALGFGRNMYDRVVHLGYGLLLALPAREVIARATGRRGASTAYFAFEFVLATSALYEIMEWVTAALVAPGLGDAFLGSQGDAFDSVEDMAAAAFGALLSLGGWLALRPWRTARGTALGKGAADAADGRAVPSGPPANEE